MSAVSEIAPWSSLPGRRHPTARVCASRAKRRLGDQRGREHV
jgi:hypothetical protein